MTGTTSNLDRLLSTLEITVRRFAAGVVDPLPERQAIASDAIGALFVLDGAAVLETAGRAPRMCPHGTMILMGPGSEFVIRRAKPEIAPLVAAAQANARLAGNYGLLDQTRVPVIEDMTAAPMVVQAWATMVAETRGQAQLGRTALVDALMKSCVVAVIRRFLMRPGISPRIVSALADPRLGGAVATILAEPAAAHSVAGLANCVGLSRSTFARQFAQALGSPPMEFVMRTRLHHAAAMLRTGRMPVKTIAAQTGFLSRSHFSRSFRDVYGVDPKTYREREQLALRAPPSSAEPAQLVDS